MFLQVPGFKIPVPEMQSALSHPELAEDVVSLTAEEALPSMPDEQSPTLMIEGVLRELAPKVQVTEARVAEKEEGSRDEVYHCHRLRGQFTAFATWSKLRGTQSMRSKLVKISSN